MDQAQAQAQDRELITFEDTLETFEALELQLNYHFIMEKVDVPNAYTVALNVLGNYIRLMLIIENQRKGKSQTGEKS